MLLCITMFPNFWEEGGFRESQEQLWPDYFPATTSNFQLVWTQKGPVGYELTTLTLKSQLLLHCIIMSSETVTTNKTVVIIHSNQYNCTITCISEFENASFRSMASCTKFMDDGMTDNVVWYSLITWMTYIRLLISRKKQLFTNDKSG